MTIATLAILVFFFALGIGVFYPHRALTIAYGVAALVLGVLTLIGVGSFTF